MAKWFIGCSGFYYNHWKEEFYPAGLAKKNWFEYYNEHFSTVELNVTFYRFPQLSMLEGWYQKSPPGYRFAVKLFKGITHYKQFINCEQLLSDFYGVVQEGLRQKLGCILIQLPPRMAFKQSMLDRIINSLDTSFANVLECRNESWWNADVFQQLTAHNITFCGQSHPLLPDDVIVNNKTLYYRFHGVPDLYLSPYNTRTLRKFARTVENNKQVKEAYVYFNNDIKVSAIDNAVELINYVAQLKKKPRK